MTKLTLAATEDLERLVPLVAAFHQEEGIVQDDVTRRDAWRRCWKGRRTDAST